ncbi:TorF family putative porin [Thalassolituus marinus]|uniref:Histidine kinase n=1 Tax=Thalassolituus marinus TaxID=671053 RepID=A0ABS7ZK34_9GAMM|nr:TorF family putative porin [Thalassolituus marinus]MCA6062068.1 hypothetical protein [Thalassolituus marinus]
MKKLTKAIVVAGVMTAGLAGIPAAQAEVSASASIASEYLWRGTTLGNGDAAFSGSLDYSHESGLYAGTWISSGDSGLGTEYDLYAGYALEAGDLGVDLGYATYIYPGADEDGIDDVAEFYLGLSYKAGSLYAYKSSDSDVDGMYLVASADVSSFSVAVGTWLDTGGDYTHLDVTYAFNDNVAFTLSQIVDEEIEDSMDMSPKLVVSYSLPIEM